LFVFVVINSLIVSSVFQVKNVINLRENGKSFHHQNAPHCINFIDFEMAFASIHRKSLWLVIFVLLYYFIVIISHDIIEILLKVALSTIIHPFFVIIFDWHGHYLGTMIGLNKVVLSCSILHILQWCIWEKEDVSSDWNKGLIVKIPKKGDRAVCDNYTCITLLSTSSKVFSKIIVQRIQRGVEKKANRRTRVQTLEFDTFWLVLVEFVSETVKNKEKPETATTYSGITIKWNKRVDKITSKANRQLNFLKRNLKISSNNWNP
jgi:hypothetical protein